MKTLMIGLVSQFKSPYFVFLKTFLSQFLLKIFLTIFLFTNVLFVILQIKIMNTSYSIQKLNEIIIKRQYKKINLKKYLKSLL